MLAGVTMVDPSRTYVDATVELARDVVLEPGVVLRGSTRIGEGTRIGAGSQIIDTVVGRDCCHLGQRPRVVRGGGRSPDRAVLAPAAPGRRSGAKVRLGNFAEVKASRLERGRPAAPLQLHRRRRAGRAHERGRGHDHLQLRRRPQAQDEDRQARLPGLGHDARGPGRAWRWRPHRRRSRWSPRTCRRACSPSVFLPGCASLDAEAAAAELAATAAALPRAEEPPAGEATERTRR